jgi:hypothetical protein
MQAIRVLVPDDVAAKLADLARQEYRAPRQQAAALLVEAIEKARLAPISDPALLTLRSRAGQL